MPNRFATALISKEPEVDYGVVFPDFPDCISGASPCRRRRSGPQRRWRRASLVARSFADNAYAASSHWTDQISSKSDIRSPAQPLPPATTNLSPRGMTLGSASPILFRCSCNLIPAARNSTVTELDINHPHKSRFRVDTLRTVFCVVSGSLRAGCLSA